MQFKEVYHERLSRYYRHTGNHHTVNVGGSIMRTATKEDFKAGNVLMDSSRHELVLTRLAYNNDHDMWLTDDNRTLFASEADHYNVTDV